VGATTLIHAADRKLIQNGADNRKLRVSSYTSSAHSAQQENSEKTAEETSVEIRELRVDLNEYRLSQARNEHMVDSENQISGGEQDENNSEEHSQICDSDSTIRDETDRQGLQLSSTLASAHETHEGMAEETSVEIRELRVDLNEYRLSQARNEHMVDSENQISGGEQDENNSEEHSQICDSDSTIRDETDRQGLQLSSTLASAHETHEGMAEETSVEIRELRVDLNEYRLSQARNEHMVDSENQISGGEQDENNSEEHSQICDSDSTIRDETDRQGLQLSSTLASAHETHEGMAEETSVEIRELRVDLNEYRLSQASNEHMVDSESEISDGEQFAYDSEENFLFSDSDRTVLYETDRQELQLSAAHNSLREVREGMAENTSMELTELRGDMSDSAGTEAVVPNDGSAYDCIDVPRNHSVSKKADYNERRRRNFNVRNISKHELYCKDGINSKPDLDGHYRKGPSKAFAFRRELLSDMECSSDGKASDNIDMLAQRKKSGRKPDKTDDRRREKRNFTIPDSSKSRQNSGTFGRNRNSQQQPGTASDKGRITPESKLKRFGQLRRSINISPDGDAGDNDDHSSKLANF
jgi:hypothetical protein